MECGMNANLIKNFVKCLFFRKKVVSLHHEKGVIMWL